MKLVNTTTGEAVYYNIVTKGRKGESGKIRYIIKGIGDTMVMGRDRQKKKSRTFSQQAQAERYLRLHGFVSEPYRKK